MLSQNSWPLGPIILALLASGAIGCSRAPQHEKASSAPAAAKPAVSQAAPAPEPAPVQPTAARGAELYARMCAVCHGADGEGYKADQATALAQPDFLASVSDDFLGFAIAEGRPGTPMSAWFVGRGGPLLEADVRALIAFLRSWQKQPSVVLDEHRATGDRARGKALFKQTCESCHGAKGPNVRIRDRAWLAHASVGFLRHAIRKGRAPTTMPGFESSLGEPGIEDVLAYLTSLPAWPTPGELSAAQQPPPLPLGPVPLNPKGPAARGFHVYPEMTPVDVVHAQLVRKARMALLDARVPSDYAQGHIAGAVSVPFYDPAPYLGALPKNAWLVCYCGCPHAESGALAEKLVTAGFKQVTVLDEGLGDWMAKGYPTRTGDKP
jgi:cytochrome c oxidase cbb3-type subunit 3/ubiquinol-cytochrome c reductase cytochrome c subunit